MTYIDDVTQSIEALIDHSSPNKLTDRGFHEVYNVGNESPVRMGDLLEYLKDKLHKEPGSVVSNPRGAEEPVMTRASTEKLKAAINYTPSTSYQTGINNFVDWYVSYYNK
jgi:UDP-glucuronate 4-epimerase